MTIHITHRLKEVYHSARLAVAVLFCFIYSSHATAQIMRDQNFKQLDVTNSSNLNNGNNNYGENNSNGMGFGGRRDTTSHDKTFPIGIFNWTIDERLGDIIPAENNDTVVNNYHNFNNTDGYNGAYNYLANIGSARLSRIYMDRDRDESNTFLFLRPLSFGITPLSEFRFTNTLCPVTNLAYHSAGSSANGEDRFRANFATNINKISGIGFRVDYLYGRGYYNWSQNSMLNGDFFGYYRGEKYQMHTWTEIGHQKNAESGGIENDLYITDPQSFQQSYGSRDIPSLLAETYNRNDYRTYHLTHRYNLGYDKELEVPDSLKPKMPTDEQLLKPLKDSIKQVLLADTLRMAATLDSLRNDWTNKQLVPTEFIPVGSIIHTINIQTLDHRYYSTDAPENYYTNHYYGDINNVEDKTTAFVIKNTLGLSMLEGFRKWVKMGITAFASHTYESYTMPRVEADTLSGTTKYTEHDFSIGGKIDKTEGKFLHYNVNGEFSILGKHIGAFNVIGAADLNFGLTKKDTVQLAAKAFIKNMKPDPYMEHYHSQQAWWDNDDLKYEKRVRIEGTLSNKRSKTSLRIGVENITNHTYFGMQNTFTGSESDDTTDPTLYSHAVGVKQDDGNIQVVSASLKQNFKLGIINWENDITYQVSSNKEILPLPTLNVYTNLYLLFRIAKVLRVELGADARYFTKYYAPDYAPAIGQFAVQDANNPRIEIGNYPIINAYANLHLKNCRIYVAANHVNASNGNMFLAPHYAINPMNIRFGVSWNFFN